MLRKKNIFLLSLLLILTVLVGCDKNPTKPEPDKPSDSDSDSLSTIIVIFENKKRDSSVEFYTSQGIGGMSDDSLRVSKSFNFVDNKAVIKFIPPGEYKILCHCRVTDTITNRTLYISFLNNIIVKGNKIIESRFILPEEVLLQVILLSRSHKPIKGAEISTDPETVTAITDEEGRAFFGTFPLLNYGYNITKHDMTVPDEYGSMTIRNGKLEEVEIHIYNYIQPVVEIISPENNHYENIYDIHLVGNGYDFEDDLLPDESLTWYSSIDGELGKGRELTLDRLNIGHHTITLVGINSDQRKSECSITLNLSFFGDESYFPLPYSGYWNYRYFTTDFSVTDDIRGTEYWTINDLQVSAEDVDTRNCLMEYTITKNDTTKYCRYYVVDHYETDSENIYITKTTEQLQIFEDENKQGVPTEQLYIETVYSPRYLMIKQYMDPIKESFYETSVTSEVSLTYNHVNSTSLSFTETIDIETSYEIGETETVETEIGTFEAVPLTIFTEDTERKWWLAKGIGIIQLEYNTFDLPLTATLYDTNIFAFSESGNTKNISKSSYYGRNHNQKVFKSPPDTPERMLELCRLLRGLCPQ